MTTEILSDLVTHNDVVIKATPASIWPYIADPNTWKTAAKRVPIGGDPGQVGERFKAVKPDDPQNVLFYLENVEIVALRRRTIRLNAPDDTLIGFASWRLTPQNGSTLVEYHVYCRVVLTVDTATASPADLAAARTGYYDRNYRRFAEEFVTLKKLVEGDS